MFYSKMLRDAAVSQGYKICLYLTNIKRLIRILYNVYKERSIVVINKTVKSCKVLCLYVHNVNVWTRKRIPSNSIAI